MFKRIIDFHLDKWKNDPFRKPLILRGARQVGKTCAVQRLGQHFKFFAEVNFEKLSGAAELFEKDLVPDKLILSLSLLIKIPIIPGETLLFFDEVQEAPRAILALRYFYEEMPKLHLIAAGSLLEFAIEKVGVPVGRISMLYMYPLSFLEYLVATGHNLLAKEIVHDRSGLPMEEPIHTQALDLVGEYLSIGGMPEAVARWVQTKDPSSALHVLQQIAATYRQDFEKYARKTQVKYLELLFRQIPHLISKDFSYREIHGEYRKRELAPALELLERANIIHTIRHASGQGIPIGSDIDFETFKLIYLDIGLCQTILGSDISIWFLRPLEGFDNRGEIAEGFIGQELICYANPENKAEIYFWKRKAKNSTAEIDYLIQQGEQILPIEVKSGHGNTLRSLHLFLESHPKSTLSIRFSSLNYSVTDKLDSRPLYAAASLAHPNQKKALNNLVGNK
ncbi:MAG: ATP-binding protein [Verrucomicrobia bacterium]|nr:ATP-binding protein [Verrucomicrobiota bacterium]MBS0645054.1 ATP-binding protein [Verrucomicrobiota bacterium]